MNEKINKNAKVEKFTGMVGIAVGLIVIDPWNAKVNLRNHVTLNKKGQGHKWRLQFSRSHQGL